MLHEAETLTEEERDDVMELPRRQPGCPDKTCGVCRDNARRSEALAKALRILDAQAARIAEVPRLMGELAFARQESRKWNQAYDALSVAHAETHAKLEKDLSEAWLADCGGTHCTPSERKVLNSVEALEDTDLDCLALQGRVPLALLAESVLSMRQDKS